MKASERNLGIDILRIVSMLGVVLLHVLGHGGLLNLPHNSLNFSMVWFLEILAFPTVNCFVLISGYVGYKGEKIYPKIKNIMNLWFSVVFYSVVIFLLFVLLGVKPLEMDGIVKCVFPTIFKDYWFFSSYFGLFLISPLLNLFVYNSNLKQAFVFLSVFFLFATVSIVYDTFSLINGYSLIWFIFIYIIGAMIKKFNLNQIFSRKIWLLITVSLIIITWLSQIIFHFSGIGFLENHSSVFVKYTSPIIVLISISTLNYFSKINCKPLYSTVISFFASSSFSVYLIHDNKYVREYLVSKLHTCVSNFNVITLFLFIVGCMLGIFIACVVIDKIRILIFKAIKIEKLAEKAEKNTKKILNMIYLKLEKLQQKSQ